MADFLDWAGYYDLYKDKFDAAGVSKEQAVSLGNMYGDKGLNDAFFKSVGGAGSVQDKINFIYKDYTPEIRDLVYGTFAAGFYDVNGQTVAQNKGGVNYDPFKGAYGGVDLTTPPSTWTGTETAGSWGTGGGTSTSGSGKIPPITYPENPTSGTLDSVATSTGNDVNSLIAIAVARGVDPNAGWLWNLDGQAAVDARIKQIESILKEIDPSAIPGSDGWVPGNIAPPGMDDETAGNLGLIPRSEIEAYTANLLSITPPDWKWVNEGGEWRLKAPSGQTYSLIEAANDPVVGDYVRSGLGITLSTQSGWVVNGDGTFNSPEGLSYTFQELVSEFYGLTADTDGDGEISAAEFLEIDRASVTQFEQQRAAQITELFEALFPSDTLDNILDRIETDQEQFMSDLQTIGRTTETERLLQFIAPGITNAELAGFFGESYIPTYEEWLQMPRQTEGTRIQFGPIDFRLGESFNILGNEIDNPFFSPDTSKEAYEKWADAVGNVPVAVKAFTAGLGDLAAMIAGASNWLGADGVASYMSEEVDLYQRLAMGLDDDPSKLTWQDIYVGAIRSMPFMLATLPAGVLAGLGGKALATTLNASKFWKVALPALTGGGVQTVIESALEAGGVYDQMLASGATPAEAHKAAQEVFSKNALLLGGMNTAQMAAFFLPGGAFIRAAEKGYIKIATEGGKIVFQGFTEGFEEFTQDVIQRQALGQEVTLDDDMKAAILIGTLMGTGFGVGGTLYSTFQNKVVQNLPDNLRPQVEQAIQSAVASGVDVSTATTEALGDIAETNPEAIQTATQIAVEELQIEGDASVLGVSEPVVAETAITQATKEPWEMTDEDFAKIPIGRYASDYDVITGEPTATLAMKDLVSRWIMRKWEDAGKPSGAAGMDYIRYGDKYGVVKAERRIVIEQALFEGKSIPASVLADYPDLGIVSKARSTTTETTPQTEQHSKATVIGDIGRPIIDGKVETVTGRMIPAPPIPKITSDRTASAWLKKMDVWLKEQSIAEAQSRNDDYNLIMFQNESTKLPPATKSSMNEYLFGEEYPTFLIPQPKPQVVSTKKTTSQNIVNQKIISKKTESLNQRKQDAGITDAGTGKGPGTPTREEFLGDMEAAEDKKIQLVDFIRKNVPTRAYATKGFKDLLDEIATVKTYDQLEKAQWKANELVRLWKDNEYTKWLHKHGYKDPNFQVVENLTPATPLNKLVKLLKEAIPATEEQKEAYRMERGKRSGAARQVLESNQGLDAFYKQLSKLQGELPSIDLILDAAGVNLTSSDIDALFSQIQKYPGLMTLEGISAQTALQNLLRGKLPTESGIDLLATVFGEELTDVLLKLRSLRERLGEEILSALNLPRALMASFDNSFALRQAATLFWGNPKESTVAVKSSFQAMFSEVKAKDIQQTIITNDLYPRLAVAEVFQSPWGRMAGKLAKREEAFMTKFAHYIPWVKMSERAYVIGLNKLRADVFYTYAKNNPNASITSDKQVAKAINILTGRGDLGELGNKLAPVLNVMLFSPRLIASRLEAPTLLFSKNPIVRKMAAKGIVSWFAMNSMFLMLIVMAGGQIEFDPRSSDFGKGRIGDTRFDFWGGFQQYARLIAQLVTEERKTTTTGELAPVNRLEALFNFLRGKLSPAFASGADLLAGETLIGEEVNVQNQLLDKLTPLFIRDMLEAIQANGLAGAFEAIPAFFGVGVQTFGIAWPDYVNKLGTEVVNQDGTTEVYTVKDMYSDTSTYYSGDSSYFAKFTPEIIQSAQSAYQFKIESNKNSKTPLYQVSDYANAYEQFLEVTRINSDPDTLEQFKKDHDGKSPESVYSDWESGNMTQAEFVLLNQYNALKTQGQKDSFLKQHPELKVNRYEDYLIENVEQNAILALWGQAPVLTIEAYNKAIELATQLGIPEGALVLPPKEIAPAFIQYQTASASQLDDIRKANPELDAWGNAFLGWTKFWTTKAQIIFNEKYK